MTLKEILPKTKEGLLEEAFAIAGTPDNPGTWKLPHHKKGIFRALRGKLDIEKTVDWELMSVAVTALSLGGHRRRRIEASPGEILEAARHLANHYRNAGKPLPDTLAALA